MTEQTIDRIETERLLMNIEGLLETLFTAQASGELERDAATSTTNCILDLVRELREEVLGD